MIFGHVSEEGPSGGRSRADSTPSDGSDSNMSSVVKEIDSGYFGSYAGFHIHEDMLKDRVRTEAYRDFIEGNPELFKDKYVMDVGCGTGILSMFAIRAGAKHVIAIDNSGIIERAKEIAKENGFENKITFIRSKAEQIEELAGVCDKVDIIISEWMGYCLLFESMLPSVLFVRDKFLKPQTGRVYPDISSLHLVGMSAPTYRTSRVDFWKKDVYGFTMESIARRVHLEPGVDHMQEYEVITDSHKFFEIDCNKVKPEQLDFEAPFTLKATKDTTMDAFVTYFDIGFLKDASKPITFTTSPSAAETHWRQTVLILEQPLQLTAGTSITGRIQLKANRESFRDLDIHLTYRVGSDANAPTKMQSFSLN
jgi:SAM-dependent methyltransferase